MEEKMKLKEAIDILEGMCFRYGEPRQKGRSKEQTREVIALNVILKELKSRGVRNMFTKKDRKIANQEAMISNRNKLIKDLETRNNMLKTVNKDLRFENEELLNTIQKILDLSTSNTYNNDKIILSKIKELAETAIKN
jgi:hypothetical protein